MKKCPKCEMELPEQAHFCPRCMYQFEKIEVKQKRIHKKLVYKWIIIGVMLFLGIKCISLIQERIVLIREQNTPLTEEGLQAIIDKHFKAPEEIRYNPEVKNDLRNYLTMDFEVFRDIIGEETKEMEMEGDIACYTYDVTRIYVNTEGLIQGIEVDYDSGENIEGYGVFGIGKGMSREDVLKYLGEPSQDYGDQLYFGFDGIYSPSFNVYLSEDGTVKRTELYYLTL